MTVLIKLSPWLSGAVEIYWQLGNNPKHIDSKSAVLYDTSSLFLTS